MHVTPGCQLETEYVICYQVYLALLSYLAHFYKILNMPTTICSRHLPVELPINLLYSISVNMAERNFGYSLKNIAVWKRFVAWWAE